MAKSKPTISPEKILSPAQMQEAIRIIDLRTEELSKFDINCVNEIGNPQVGVLESKLDTFLSELFGHNTPSYNRYEPITRLDYYIGIMVVGYRTPIADIRNAVQRNIKRAIEELKGIKSGFNEKLEPKGESTALARIINAYKGLNLHPVIADAASDLYVDGHYASAILEAVKALNNYVRLRSGINEDGVKLMQQVFSKNNPILKFNDLADESDLEEQKGYMDLFCGAVTGLRNPRAHKIIKDDPERALEFIAFISLLAKLAESAKK